MHRNEYRRMAHEEVEEIFREILPQAGMKVREEQITLCHQMLSSLCGNKIALCDAAVGVGKTYAYLVACILFRKYSQLILSPKRVEKMDIGVLKREGKGRRFAVSAGIGFDAAVCHEVCVSKWKRVLNLLKIGKLSYAVVAMDRIIKDRPVKLELTLDDGSMKVFERTYFAAFMNLPYEGGGFKFCPDASGSDGFLDIMVVSDLSKLKILCLLPTAFSGKHTRFKGVTILKCRSVKVVTDRALPLHTDGEPSFLSKEIEVSLEKEKLNVIVE